jgi:pimeloyl-[acyl-carrier protein] methyl ester esterase
VDLPGYGRSAYDDYSLPRLIERLTTALPPNAIWLGWSLGGLLAMAIARWQPVAARALILVATSPRFTVTEQWPHALQPNVLENFSKQLQEDSVNTVQRFLALQIKGSESAQQQLRTLKTWLKNAPPPQPQALHAGLNLLRDTDLRAELAQIHCPALLCLGGHDTIVPAAVGKDCQVWWPTLQKVCIKPAAHIPFLSHPQLFLHLVKDFLHGIGLGISG